MRTYDGLELHVTTCTGRTTPPVTVVLAHCWTADEADWHYQVRDLLTHFGHEVRIVTWDHRGHGQSETCGTADCTIDNLARDMGDVDRPLRTARAALVLAGHSIGGMTMMRARRAARPDLLPRIAGLLFVSTSSGRPRHGHARAARGGHVRPGPDPPGARHPRPDDVPAQPARLTADRAPGRASVPVRPGRRGSRDIGLVVDQLINCSPGDVLGLLRAT